MLQAYTCWLFKNCWLCIACTLSVAKLLTFHKLLVFYCLYSASCKAVGFSKTIGFAFLSVLCLLLNCWLFTNFRFCILVCTLFMFKLLTLHKLCIFVVCTLIYTVFCLLSVGYHLRVSDSEIVIIAEGEENVRHVRLLPQTYNSRKKEKLLSLKEFISQSSKQ